MNRITLNLGVQMRFPLVTASYMSWRQPEICDRINAKGHLGHFSWSFHGKSFTSGEAEPEHALRKGIP